MSSSPRILSKTTIETTCYKSCNQASFRPYKSSRNIYHIHSLGMQIMANRKQYERLLIFLLQSIPKLKGSLDATIKLLPCDPEATNSNFGNNLLQNKIKLHIIDSSPEFHIDGNFTYWTALFIGSQTR